MKRNGATVLLVGVLLVAAVGLGVMNKVRTDRRAEKVAESLNRKESPKGASSQEGYGRISTSEPGDSPRDNRQESSSPSAVAKADPYRIDLGELRRAVLAGDVKAVEGIRGNLQPEDAATFHELLFQVPDSLAKENRDRILSALANMLQKTQGDEAARLLFDAVLRDGLIPDHQWQVSLHVIGQKRYKAAQSFLEDLAFSRNETDKVYSSGCALLLISPESTLNRLKIEIRTAGIQRLATYIQILNQANTLHSYYPDIRPAVPSVKERFRFRSDLPAPGRVAIATFLTEYARRQDPDLKAWLKTEIRNAISSTEGNTDGEADSYRNLLKSLE